MGVFLFSGTVALGAMGTTASADTTDYTQYEKKQVADVKPGDTISYMITGTWGNKHKVTGQNGISDKLPDGLIAKGMKVYDSNPLKHADAKDITAKGKVTTKGNVTTWMIDSANNGVLFNHTVYAIVTVQVAPDGSVDLGKYLNKDGQPELLNQGGRIEDGKSNPTDKPKVLLPKGKDAKVIKKVIDPTTNKPVTSATVTFNKTYHYQLKVTTPSYKDLSKVTFTDDPDDDIIPTKLTVQDAKGEDVTAKGTVTLKNTGNTLATWKNSKEYKVKAGSTYTLDLTAKVKKTDALNKQALANKLTENNRASLSLRDKQLAKSNTVKVKVKGEQPDKQVAKGTAKKSDPKGSLPSTGTKILKSPVTWIVASLVAVLAMVKVYFKWGVK